MTLIIVGSSLNANTYVDVPFIRSFFTDRGNTAFLALSDVEIEPLLVKACDFLERTFIWQGSRLDYLQRLSFPRKDLYDNQGNSLVGVPFQVQEAQCLVAEALFNGFDLYGIISNVSLVKRKQAEGLSVEYFSPVEQGVSGASVLTHVYNLLRPFTSNTALKRC